MHRPIEILLCGDDKMFTSMEVLICSTSMHNTCIHWHIFTMNASHCNKIALTQEHRQCLTKLVKSFPYNSTIKFYDIDKEYQFYLRNSVNDNCIFTPYAGLRLLADILLPGLEKVLYLDCDCLVQGQLNNLFNNYAEHFCYAAVFEPMRNKVNSGVILFNLNKCRERNILSRVREKYNKNKYRCPDQEALEEIMLPEPLALCYNHMVNPFTYSLDLDKHYYPCILHFGGENGHKLSENTFEEWLQAYPEYEHIVNYIKEQNE